MIEPGRLNRRLTLEAPVETADGAGGVTRSFQAVATLWAELTPVGARPGGEADARGARISHRIVIRAGADITTRHRFRDGGRVLRILALREAAGGRLRVIDAIEQID